MTTTSKSSFLIDDLLSAFKQPTAPVPLLITPNPSIPSKDPVPVFVHDPTSISFNFFQPPNHFNQYAAIKPELHPFLFYGMLTWMKDRSSILGRRSPVRKSTGGHHLLFFSFFFCMFTKTTIMLSLLLNDDEDEEDEMTNNYNE